MPKIKIKGWLFTSILAIFIMVPSIHTNAQSKKKKSKKNAKQFELNDKMLKMLSFRSIALRLIQAVFLIWL